MMSNYVKVFPTTNLLGNEFWGAFEDMWKMVEPISKLPECLVSGDFPPTNIMTDKDDNYIIQMSIAGYPENGIDISFQDEYLIVKLTPADNQFEGFNMKMHGIRSSKAERKIFIPSKKFNAQATEASTKDGILTIKIPTKEEAKPFTIPINKE